MAIERKPQSLMPSFFSDFFENDNFWNVPSLLPSMAQQRQNLPAVNIKETENEYQIEVATPGIPKENIHVSVENNMLTIEGESKFEKEEKSEKEGQYTRREFGFTSFSRSFRLPEGVNPDQIKAQSENGILNLSIPKSEMEVKKAKKEIKIG